MSLFKKKSIWRYKILEKYKIDIAKTNQSYTEGLTNTDNSGRRLYCELVAEDNDYCFYSYKTYPKGGGGCLLRQEKRKPKKVVFFGEHKDFNCIFKGYLFQVDRSIERDTPGITARNTSTGSMISFNWLSDKGVLVFIGLSGSIYCQDQVTGMNVADDKLIINISRNESDDAPYNSGKPDIYDRRMDFLLEVELIGGKFIATPIYPPIDTTCECEDE